MRTRILGLTIALVLMSTVATTSPAQEAAPNSAGEPTANAASPAGMERKKVKMPDGKIREISLPPGAALPPGVELATDDKPADGAKDATKGKDEKSADEANAPVTRENEPPNPPDPAEFDIEADNMGMIQFQFRNQRWPELLRWLAEISQMSLDWQELPGDYLNLATQRAYTIEEARDLFNGHLLARGYTMLEHDSVIHVFKTEGINLALVPSVRSSELANLPRNRFVRTSFKLATLIVDDIVEELQPLKSPNGQLIALTATNRLEAIDSVSSLRAIKQILDDEQSDEALELLAQEFPLTHIRAEDAKRQLEIFLGIKEESASAGGSMDAQMSMMQRQMQQQMQQMQQQSAQKAGPAGKAPREEGKVYLVANMRKNSVIAHAPPDKQAIIAAFVHRIDVPGDAAMSLTMLQSRMKTYRMASLNPEQLVNSLYNMDALEPMTRIEIDAKNKAIIVFASLVDHMLIEQVIKRLDGSAREFDVIQLRRLFAEDVAGTVKMMMGADEEKDSQSSRYSYYYYNPRGAEEEDKDKFRVAANVNDNQLLIWANELEREEINKLLIKLGELPPEGGSRSPYRTIDAAQMPETYEYLQRIQQRWQQMSDIPIVLPEKEIFQPRQEPAKDSPTEENATEAAAPSEEPASDSPDGNSPDDGKITEVRHDESDIPLGILAQIGDPQQTKRVSADASTENGSSQDAKSSIRIGVDGRGNLILYSENTEALNALEALMMDVTPPKRPYDVVTVKHQTATWITYDLEDYFKDLDSEKKDEDPREAYYRYIFDLESGTSKEKPAQLGRKRPLRFIPSNDTQTILVIGADAETLEIVKRLVELWDVPDKVDDTRVRYTQIVPIKYSRAELLVETMKEAFRDLLSSNDKAFQKNGDERGGGDRNGGAAALNSSSVTDEGGMDFSFSGRLSFGVDKVTNSILVSSEKQLLQLLVSTIEKLDEAARPSGNLEVHQMNLGGQDSLKEALKAILGTQDRAQKQPDGQQPANQNGQSQVNPNGSPMNAQQGNRGRE